VKVPSGVTRPHLIVHANLAESPEERIAMSGQSHVAGLSGQRGAANVSDRESQRAGIATGANDRRHVEPRDLEPAEQ
jgi:hypothetical protein